MRELTNEFIRGFIEGEGCFTFHSNTLIRNGKTSKKKTPAFSIQLNERDKELLYAIRDYLKIKNRIYNYRGGSLTIKTSNGDKVYIRGRKVMLVVRDLGSLKNTIIPFFYKKLRGYKSLQFIDWLENIGRDNEVQKSFKILYELYKSGFYEKNFIFD